MEEYVSPAQKTATSPEDVTQVVLETLLCVYHSKADLSRSDLVEQVGSVTGFDASSVTTVVDKLFSHEKAYLRDSEDPQYKTIFGTEGLWLLENVYMHNEETVNPLALGLRILKQHKFLEVGASQEQEYLTANASILQAITRAFIEKLESPGPDFVIQVTDGEASFQFGELPSDDDSNIADDINTNNLLAAEIAVNILRAGYALQNVLADFDTGVVEDSAVDNDFEPYDKAVFQKRRFYTETAAVELSQTTLLVENHLLERHTIEVFEAQVKSTLSLITMDEKPLIIAHQFGPTNNLLVEHAVRVFGAEAAADFMAKVVKLYGQTMYQPEEEIEAELNDMWLDYLGTSREAEVVSLLEEALQFIRAHKDQAMLVPNGWQQPTEDRLTDYLNILT